jgi:hypothetical protein
MHSWIGPSAWLAVASAWLPPATQPAPPPPEPIRARGVIDRDTRWSGRVLVTDDLHIEHATVTVDAGTVVEFARVGTADHPTLTVGGPASPGEVRLLSTPERPVVFRTREGTPAGRLILHVGGGARRAEAGGEVAWRHARFEGLGFCLLDAAGRRKLRRFEPAVQFVLSRPADRLSIEDCEMVDSSRIQVRAPASAKVSVRQCRFSSPRERMSLEVANAGGVAGGIPVEIGGNRAAGAIVVRGLPATIDANLVVGLDASIILEKDESPDSRIRGNYVHNTTTSDDGRYGLKCENPAARIDRNVIRGGTTGVLGGSRHMSANVILGAPGLTSPTVRLARTHALVAGLPVGAVFEDNLLIGPAHSLLVAHSAAAAHPALAGRAPMVIRHNLFDGVGGCNRAIQTDWQAGGQHGVEVAGNLFLRVPTLVAETSRAACSLRLADWNAVAPLAHRPWHQVHIDGLRVGEEGWGGRDVTRDTLAGLGLSSPPAQPPAPPDDDLLSGRLTIESFRAGLFEAYAPLADSPLLGAGRPAGGASRPPIGPRPGAGR